MCLFYPLYLYVKLKLTANNVFATIISRVSPSKFLLP